MLNPDDFPKPLMLDVGAGDVRNPGATTVDLFTDADIQATMWDIPLPDECVDLVYANNSLEHVSKFDIIPTLREWHRLLKWGGSCVIIVPDLEWACQFWLECQGTEWPMDIIYGNQNHGGEFHKTGFTKQILWDYLVIANPGEWFVERLDYMDGTGCFEKHISPSQKEGVVDIEFRDVYQRLIICHARKATQDMLVEADMKIEPVVPDMKINLRGAGITVTMEK